jgi:hypothetical protein
MNVILSRRRRISSITLTLPIGMGEGEDEILRRLPQDNIATQSFRPAEIHRRGVGADLLVVRARPENQSIDISV